MALVGKETMQRKSCNLGLDDRCRDQNGQIRKKNGSTTVGSLRDVYGPDFAAGVRSDARLRTLLRATGTNSLSEFRKKFGS